VAVQDGADPLPLLAETTLDHIRRDVGEVEYADILECLVHGLGDDLARLPLFRGNALLTCALNLKGTAALFGLKRLEAIASAVACTDCSRPDRRLILTALKTGRQTVRAVAGLLPDRQRPAA
jgi:hypothetical protein